MCFAPQPRAIFADRNLQNRSANVVFCAFWLRNALFATAACHFLTSKLQKVLRHRQFLSIFTSKCAFRHSGVPFFTCLLNSYLRTRRFSEPTFRTSGTTNHWENTAIRDVPNIFRACTFFYWLFTRVWIFFLRTWHLYSAFQLCKLSEVRLLNFLRLLKYYSDYQVPLQYYSVLQSTTPVLLCTTKYYSSTTPVLLCTTSVLLQYYSVLQSTTPVLQRTTLYYIVLLQYYSVLQSSTPVYYSVLQSTTPVLLRTTKYYSSTTLYYKVLLQYYAVLQSTTPVLLRTTKYYSSTTKYYSSTTLYYKVLLQYYSVLQSTTPVLLRTTKYYSSTTPYYKVLLQYYKVLQSTTPVLLCTTPVLVWNVIYNARSYKSHPPTSPNTAPATQNQSHDWSASHMKGHLQCAEQQESPSNFTK